MNLNEILSGNLTIIKLKEIDIDFIKSYNLINDYHDFMLKPKVGTSRHRIILNNIELLENRIKNFNNYDFDPDPDIDNLKDRAKFIYNELQRIKSEIP